MNHNSSGLNYAANYEERYRLRSRLGYGRMTANSHNALVDVYALGSKKAVVLTTSSESLERCDGAKIEWKYLMVKEENIDDRKYPNPDQ